MMKSAAFNNRGYHTTTFCSYVVIIFFLFIGSSMNNNNMNGVVAAIDSDDDRRMNIQSYVKYRQAFLIFEKPFLEIFNPVNQGQDSSAEQMVTTLYWLGPPQYNLDDDGNIDTIVARVIEYVSDPIVADSNQFIVPSGGFTLKFNPAGFAGSWNNVLQYYESVIIDIDPNDVDDKSQYRWSEAGYPLAAIIEFEPSDFVGAVKARWVFDPTTTTTNTSGTTELQQLENDLDGQSPTPEVFETLYNDIISSNSPNPNPNYPKKYHTNNSNNNNNKSSKKEKSSSRSRGGSKLNK